MYKIVANYLKTFCEETFVDLALGEDKRFAVLDIVGLKESRDDIRSQAYTQSILQYCNNPPAN